jgi:uncharacterized LabA/DUF88 family protein
MKAQSKTIAYIDGANLHKGIKSLGWKLDYGRFRQWLSHRYGVGSAYIFIGMVSEYAGLYNYLQGSGFRVAFKEVIFDGDGKPKGNCDADLIVQAMRDSYEGTAEQYILVTSDGDYTPLVKFLLEKKQLIAILSPAPAKKCSILLKRTGAPIVYLNDKKELVRLQNEKAPGRDAPLQGSFS